MIEFQTWICPKCYDDHHYGGPCTPKTVCTFSPSKDDGSYIAQEFRKLESKCARQAELLERANHITYLQDAGDEAELWRADYDRLKGEK